MSTAKWINESKGKVIVIGLSWLRQMILNQMTFNKEKQIKNNKRTYSYFNLQIFIKLFKPGKNCLPKTLD